LLKLKFALALQDASGPSILRAGLRPAVLEEPKPGSTMESAPTALPAQISIRSSGVFMAKCGVDRSELCDGGLYYGGKRGGAADVDRASDVLAAALAIELNRHVMGLLVLNVGKEKLGSL
jgi:hypothetical protein